MKERLQLKKWLNGITNVLFCLCLLVVILIVLQVFVVTSFKIPSDSMEPSLLASVQFSLSGQVGQHCAGRDVVLREALYRRAG